MYCRKCGKAIIYRQSKASGTRLICPNKYCDVSSADFEDVEDAVLNALKEKLGELEIEAKKPKADSTTFIKSTESIEKELKQIQKQQNKLYDLLEQGVYSQEIFLERQQTLHAKRKELQDKLIELRRNAPSSINYEPYISNIKQLLSDYTKLDVIEKNALLIKIIKRISYYRPSSNRFHQTEIAVKIELLFHEY